MRRLLDEAHEELHISSVNQATIGITQGPRLETLAEINRLERDGCDLIGMSGMPETILARELQLHYAAIVLVVRKAAGRKMPKGDADNETRLQLQQGKEQMHSLLAKMIAY